MPSLLSILKTILLFILLTVLTQIGGLIYLIYKPFGLRVQKRIKPGWKQWLYRLALFSLFLLITSILIVPPIARQFGRVPLPWFATKEKPLKPANIITCLANRHYVRPELHTLAIDLAKAQQQLESKTKLIYLDANFPFFDNFPLFPHLSHNDGRKLDFCFLYKDARKGTRLTKAPTFFGYGLCEIPQKGEVDQPANCAKQGYWQYSLIRGFTLPKSRYVFDEEANAALLKRMATDSRVGKLFIEPHLETRLGLSGYPKVRYHGCKAVRHDDHIHLQL